MAARFTYTGMFCYQDTFILLFLYVCHFNSSAFFIFIVFQAVQNGLWVVFEDVDKAPSDVQSILLPLLEGGNTFSTGHGEVFIFFPFPLISIFMLKI